MRTGTLQDRMTRILFADEVKISDPKCVDKLMEKVGASRSYTSHLVRMVRNWADQCMAKG